MELIDNNTLLYLRGDSFKDLSPNKIKVTNSGVTVVNSGPFGKSFRFKSSNTFMYFVSDLFKFGTGDFTIEYFVKFTDTHGYQPMFMSGTSGNQAELTKCSIYECRHDFGGNLGGGGGGTISVQLNPWSGVWIHVAMVRHNGYLNIYLNGKLTSSIETSYNLQNTRYSVGKDLWYPSNYINGYMYNIRVSDIARYTNEFTPPTEPFYGIDINVSEKTNNTINFNVSIVSDEVVNKVEVLVNGVLSETYSDIGDLSYTVDKNLLSVGLNEIKIRVSFNDKYTKENNIDYEYEVDKLPDSLNLKDSIDRQELLTYSIEMQKNNLKAILQNKNIEVSDSDNKLSALIQKVGELPSMKDVKELQIIQYQIENKISILEQNNQELREELTQIQTSIASLTSLITATLEEK